MLGTKLYKGKYIDKEYADLAVWCNENNATIEDKGEYYECVAIPAPSLDELKAQKLTELKTIRDNEEVKPIVYNGNLFDFDGKARDRINAAIVALSVQGTGADLMWTTADNKEVPVTADDLRMVIAAVAVRSNKLHTAYREAKAQVGRCATAAELEAIKVEH